MFIECNVFLYDAKLEKLGIKDADDQDDIPAKFMFDVTQVIGFRERMYKDKLCDKSCIIYLRDGDNFGVDISYSDMKKYTKKYLCT